jgi:hypothetical protein
MVRCTQKCIQAAFCLVQYLHWPRCRTPQDRPERRAARVPEVVHKEEAEPPQAVVLPHALKLKQRGGLGLYLEASAFIGVCCKPFILQRASRATYSKWNRLPHTLFFHYMLYAFHFFQSPPPPPPPTHLLPLVSQRPVHPRETKIGLAF